MLFGKNILFQQNGITDCGPCCLCSLAGFYGKRISTGHARRITGTGREGTTVLGMTEGARKIGIDLQAVRSDLSQWNNDDWKDLPLPAIVHLSKRNGLLHYVIAYRCDGKTIRYMDPADGRIHDDQVGTFAQECSGVFLLAGKSTDFTSTPEGTMNLRFLIGLIAGHRTYIILAYLCSMLVMFLSIILAVLSGKVMDSMARTGSVHIGEACLIFLSIILTLLGINSFTIWYRTKVSKAIDNSLVDRLCRHLFSLSADFFDSISVGEVVSRIFDVSRIKGFVTDGVSGIALGAFMSFGAVIILFHLSVPLGLCAVTLIPAYTGICWYVNRYLRRNRMQMMESQAVMTSRLTENVALAMKTRQLCWQDGVTEKIREAYERFTSVGYGGLLRLQAGSLAVQTLCGIATVVLIIISSVHVGMGKMTVGDVVIAMTIFAMYETSITSVIGFLLSWPEIRSASERLSDIMSVKPERKTGIDLSPDLPMAVEFRDVSFSYGYGVKVLEHFCFKAVPGEITLIKGRNGTGKSTTARLLLGLYEADSGDIIIGGHSIGSVSPDSLRKAIGYCEQPAALYNQSIRENVLCGLSLPDEEIIKSLRRTGFNLSRFNLDMLVGEGGKNLSGGESQKICIARMLIRNPSVLILDEPTAFADAEGTRCITNILLSEKTAGRTVIVITHDDRLNAVADHIFIPTEIQE